MASGLNRISVRSMKEFLAYLFPLNAPCRRASSVLERGLPPGPVVGTGAAAGAPGAGAEASGAGAEGLAAAGGGAAGALAEEAAPPLLTAPCWRASSILERGFPLAAGAAGAAGA